MGRGIAALWVMCLASLVPSTAIADFTGGGEPVKDFASYNVKTIALVVIGTWKGSDAKVDPQLIGEVLKAKLREKGYEVTVVRNSKELRQAQKNVDAILTVKYRSMVGQKHEIIVGDNRTEEWLDRYITGTAELVATKRISKRKKSLFRAKGTTQRQVETVEPGSEEIYRTDPIDDFCKIIDDLPPAPGAEPKQEQEE